MERIQLRIVKTILESSLEEELLMELRASRYKRTSSRKNYQNGHYERSFETKYSVISHLNHRWKENPLPQFYTTMLRHYPYDQVT